MKNFRTAASGVAAATLLVLLPLGGAQARIECDGNFQVAKNGNTFTSPYCQEQNLARVARGYGMRTSFEEIRRSDSVKGQICRAIGHDNRVREACLPFRNEGGPVFRN
jgi:hypothetical protein